MNRVIYVSIFLAFNVVHAQVNLDPWNNSVEGNLFQLQRVELERQTAGLHARMAKLADDRAALESKMSAYRENIGRFKVNVTALTKAEHDRLDEMLVEHEARISESRKLLDRANEARKAIETAHRTAGWVADIRQSMRLLEPILANTAANRSLWLRAIDGLAKVETLDDRYLSGLEALKVQMIKAEKAPTRRLLADLTAKATQLGKIIDADLILQLKLEIEAVCRNLANQLEGQEAMAKLLETVKAAHDSVRQTMS